MKYFMIISIWLCFAPLFFYSAGCTYTAISTREHQVVFKYSDERRSEKNLPICRETSVCSILHKRYWLPIISERLCRCNGNDECPWKWSNELDDQTMILNNRAQLKFCSSITNQQKCSNKQTALITKKMSTKSDKPFHEIKVNCYCSKEHHWKHFKTTQHVSKINGSTVLRDEFKCAPLKRCKSKEICGNVRIDYNSVYYSCSCPLGHMCMYKNTNTRIVDELLYKGPAYIAYCETQSSDEYDY